MKSFFSKKMVAAIVVATILFLVIKPKTTYLIYVEGKQFAITGNDEVIDYKGVNSKYYEYFTYHKYQKEEGVPMNINTENVPGRYELVGYNKNYTLGKLIQMHEFPPLVDTKYHDVKVKDVKTLCNIEYIKTVKTYREYFYYPKTILRWIRK